MRFYAVKIDGAPSAFPEVPGCPVKGAQFSTVADLGDGLGQRNDPGALQLIMKIEMVSVSAVTPNSFIRFYGVDINMLKQASNLTGLPIEIYAGFWPSLPLATEEAPYAGAIYCGQIWQAFGNWQETDMTLDLLLNVGNTAGVGGEQVGPQLPAPTGGPGPAPQGQSARLRDRQIKLGTMRPWTQLRGVRNIRRPSTRDLGSDIGSALSSIASTFGVGAGWGSTPANLIHNWQPNELLSNSIRRTLTQAFPQSTIDISIASVLKNVGAQDSGFYQSLEQFMGFARQTSLSQMSGTKGAVGTVSGLVGAMAKGSGDKGLQTLADALKTAGANSTMPGSDKYQGIHAFVKCARIIVTDYTSVYKGPTLKFEELIGQPTWLQSNVITFRTPMRSDIYPPVTVILPPDTLEFVTPTDEIARGTVKSLNVNFANQPVNLQQVTAVGDSRNPDGGSWSLQCTGTVTNAAFEAQLLSNPLGVTGEQLGFTPFETTTPQSQRYRLRAVQRYR